MDQTEVIEFVCRVMPDALDGIAKSLVQEAYNYSRLFISINAFFLIWAASTGVWSLYNGLNEAFGLEDTQNKTVSFLKALLYTVVAGVGLALIMILSLRVFVIETIIETTPGLGPNSWLIYVASLLMGMIVSMLLIAACYAYLPMGRRKFIRQLPSAALAVIICNLFWYLIDIAMNLLSTPDMLLDNLAAAILFIFWIYLTGYTILACGFLSNWLARQRES